MNTKKHLYRLSTLTAVAIAFCVVAAIIGFISVLAGESPTVLICSIFALVVFYGNLVLINVVIDFHNAIVGEATVEDDKNE